MEDSQSLILCAASGRRRQSMLSSPNDQVTKYICSKFRRISKGWKLWLEISDNDTKKIAASLPEKLLMDNCMQVQVALI